MRGHKNGFNRQKLTNLLIIKIKNMKTLILITGLLLSASITSFAQCGKKVTLTSSGTQHLDAKGTVLKTVDEKAIINIEEKNIKINVNDEHEMEGTIKSMTCDWKVPYKDGKSVIKTTMNEGGEDRDVTITIEGTDGKVTLLYEMDGMPDERIKVAIVKFEEVK